MPRGGKRPGAGAPEGNLNGFKTGKHSPRFQALVEAVARIPQLRDMALAHHRLQMRRQRQAKAIIRQHLIETLLKKPEKFNQIMRALNQLEKLQVQLGDGAQNFQDQSIPIHNNQIQSRPSYSTQRP